MRNLQEQSLYRKVILVIVLVVVLIGLIHYTSLNRSKISLFEALWRDALAPFQLGLSRVQRFCWQQIDTLKNLRGLQEKNRELQALVAELEYEVSWLRNYQRENEWLREALDFKSDVPHDLLVAEVIGRSPNNWESTIIINKGQTHGVTGGMAVITNAGIVGTVLNSSYYTSTVLLTIDPQAAVGGLVQSSGDLVLVEGGQLELGLLVATPLARDTQVEPGDIIVTSGLSRIYPKNVLIGEVLSVEPRQYDLSFAASVQPFVDFTRLEYVLVVLPND